MPETTNPDADEGTLLHKAMEDPSLRESLTEEQRELCERCDVWLRELIERTSIGSVPQYREAAREVPVVAFDAQGEKLYDGTCDLILEHVDKTKVIIVDWKFGRNPLSEITAAAQMAGYAGCWGAYEVDAWIFQPRLNATYHAYFPHPQLELGRIIGLIAACKAPDAPLMPGKEQCQYCKALGTCPAIKQQVEAAVAIRPPIDLAVRIAEALEIADVAEEWSKAVRDAAKGILRVGEKIPGWKLQERQGIRQIKDANACFQAMVDYMSPGEFIQAVEVKLGKLEEIYCGKVGGKKAEAKASFNAALSGVIEHKPSYQALVRAKEST
jgi:hypothetical protein